MAEQIKTQTALLAATEAKIARQLTLDSLIPQKEAALAESDISAPYFGVGANERPLVSKLLENAEYYKEYKAKIFTFKC